MLIKNEEYKINKNTAKVTEFDTITAISTPPGEGAISIVRLSGDESLAIIKCVYRGKDLDQVASHTINYGHIIDPKTDAVVDEVMVSVMRAPKTFTREDVIEINCHFERERERGSEREREKLRKCL